MGAITPIGNSVEEFWNGIKEGKTGFGPITYFDTADYRCKLAAEVKDFDPTQYMDKKSARRMEQFCQFAVAAAGQAIADAGLIMEQEDPYMVGCSVGSGIGSLQAMEREYDRLKEKGPGRVGPMLVPLMISNMAAGNVSIAYGLKGKSLNVVTACATGTHSIGEAYRTIQYGDADVMVAGGTESSITPIGIAGFSALTALSFSEDPQRASIPFDINAHGTSTHHNDLFETRAIKLAFGEHAYDLKINSTKSMVGHLLGAAGAVEFVTCVKEIQEGYIHRTVGLRETEEELDLNYCRDSYEEEVPYALTNSLGFGGHNASLLLKKYME